MPQFFTRACLGFNIHLIAWVGGSLSTDRCMHTPFLYGIALLLSSDGQIEVTGNLIAYSLKALREGRTGWMIRTAGCKNTVSVRFTADPNNGVLVGCGAARHRQLLPRPYAHPAASFAALFPDHPQRYGQAEGRELLEVGRGDPAEREPDGSGPDPRAVPRLRLVGGARSRRV